MVERQETGERKEDVRKSSEEQRDPCLSRLLSPSNSFIHAGRHRTIRTSVVIDNRKWNGETDPIVHNTLTSLRNLIVFSHVEGREGASERASERERERERERDKARHCTPRARHRRRCRCPAVYCVILRPASD